MIEEPEEIKIPEHEPHLSELWGKLRNVWQDTTFRGFLYVEVMLVPMTQALPFFTLFARRELGVEAESLGPHAAGGCNAFVFARSAALGVTGAQT